jgi:hypothetical protein
MRAGALVADRGVTMGSREIGSAVFSTPVSGRPGISFVNSVPSVVKVSGSGNR